MNPFSLRSLAVAAALAAAAHLTPAMAQEMRIITDDTGTEVSVPVRPQRIVSLHDSKLTIPLIELGIIPVGSHGRGDSEATAFIRSSAAVTGVDFDNSDITWVGGKPADIEKIASLNPDLILTTTWQSADLDQLRALAPTVVFDYTKQTEWEIYAMIADIVGANDKLAVMERRYQSQIALIREVIDTETIMVSTLHAQSKSFFAFNPYFNIGKVLLDAGFQRPAAIEAIPEGDRIDVSAEALQEFDGDFIMTTYRSSRQQYPDAVTGYMESLFPGFCVQLHACREGQMIYLSRAEAAATSYYALGAVASSILTSLGGRDFTAMPR